MLLLLLKLLGAHPFIGLLLSFILSNPVAFLDAANELIFLAGDLLEVTVCELAPLFADRALHLFPVAFDSIPIHEYMTPFLRRGCTTKAAWKLVEAIDESGSIQFLTWKYFPSTAIIAGIFGSPKPAATFVLRSLPSSYNTGRVAELLQV